MENMEYRNIKQLKEFLQEEEIKQLINQKNFKEIFKKAYGSKNLYHYPRAKEDLINDLIILFYTMYQQKEYSSNKWVLIEQMYLGWAFINWPQQIHTYEINYSTIYNSFETAEKDRKKLKEDSPWKDIKILGI